jgi:hypothetical protein
MFSISPCNSSAVCGFVPIQVMEMPLLSSLMVLKELITKESLMMVLKEVPVLIRMEAGVTADDVEGGAADAVQGVITG